MNFGNLMYRPIILAVVMGATFCIQTQYVCAQAFLRESLERLDRNKNDHIDPDEVTPLARPYLERIARVWRMSLDESNPIDRLQGAARYYHALRNGQSDRDVRPQSDSTVKPFGPDPGEPVVPEFGLGEVKFPYTQEDLDFADRTLASHDRNGDGYIDRREAERNRWTHRNPWDDDLNKDDRLSRLEMAQRYARRRLLDDASDELRQRERRLREERRWSDDDDDRRRDDSRWSRRGGIDYWLTSNLLDRFDENRNGRLEQDESDDLGLPISQIDVDRDGELSRDELFAYLSEVQEELKDYAEGLPGWFYELDADQDGQIQMSEFASDWSEEKIEEFERYDLNQDGLVTAMELTQSIASVGGSYRNENAEVIPPRKTIISEIEVADDFLIRDLNVQISITHTYTSHLDAYLTGPDGQRIELFSSVGGSDDHFDRTIFDDQADPPINKSRPPFRGRYKPEGLVNRQPGLSAFNGKSAQGVWQLVIRATRSERFGMLHSWSLNVQPLEE